MKQRLLAITFAVLILACLVSGARAAHDPPTTWSLAGVASWAQVLIASGTSAPSATASFTNGDLFVQFDSTASWTLWRLATSTWKPISGSGATGGGGEAFTILAIASGGTNAGNATDARTNLNVYSKEESDALSAPGSLRYYFGSSTSDISTYLYMATAPYPVADSAAYPTIGTTNTLCAQFLTPSGTPNLTTWISGEYEVHSYLTKTGAGDISVTYELWAWHVGSATTFIASSVPKVYSGTVASPEEVSGGIHLASASTRLATDRFLIKCYIYRVGTAGATRWFGGDYDSFFGAQISARSFLRTDASNVSSTTVALANLGIPNHDKVVVQSSGTWTLGNLPFDSGIGRLGTGTIFIASYACITPMWATPTVNTSSPTHTLATGTLWWDANYNKLKAWDGTSWQTCW